MREYVKKDPTAGLPHARLDGSPAAHMRYQIPHLWLRFEYRLRRTFTKVSPKSLKSGISE